MRIVVINHVTLDGVMQGPGRPDEDTRDGFSHGGWAERAEDPVINEAIGERMSQPDGAMLLGRRSYEDMLAAWNRRGGPYRTRSTRPTSTSPRAAPRPSSSGRTRPCSRATYPPRSPS